MAGVVVRVRLLAALCVVSTISLPLFLAISRPLIVLFPAVAVDGPDAGWRLVVAAWGHWWRIFFFN
jgi:hypothetical protein